MVGKPQNGRQVALTNSERVEAFRQRRAISYRVLTEALAQIIEARTITEARRIAQIALSGKCNSGTKAETN